MRLFRRILVSFVILFDILAFAIIFLIMSNASPAPDPDLLYLVENDAVTASLLSLVGIVATVALALVMLRGSVQSRRREALLHSERRGRITGE